MSTRKQDKVVQNLFQQIWQLSKTNPKQQMQWLLRGLLVSGRQQRFYEAGFVLPTVAMVSLVIVLLTTAMMFRAFDRSKYASNVRVNEAVMNAATPALDRAKAKLDALFAGNDPNVPRSTPSDTALYNALTYKTATSDPYTLGDETRLKIAYDINNNGRIEKQPGTKYVLENDETSNSAWRFPIDTDNNGKFDSYTLYSILLRSPSRTDDIKGQFDRARNPLEARTPPMEGGTLRAGCENASETSASLVGDSDWYKSGAKLTKSFFVYTATVPIITPPAGDSNYEPYKGNKGFSALEFQQDRGRIPLNNNAAWYEDDIEVSYANIVRLNGRIATNSNLMVGGNPNSSARTIFYQVSDPKSCYYEQENSKIIIGGNVANADVAETTDLGLVEVHAFQGKGVAPDGLGDLSKGISTTNKTTNRAGGSSVGYNNRAYSQRIGLMVEAAIALHPATDPTQVSVRAVVRYPEDVKIRFSKRLSNPSETKEPRKILREELETYFKARTRRVPYADVSGLGSYTTATVLGSTSPIRPPNEWMAIEDPVTNSASGYTNLTMNFASGNLMNLKATEPKQQEEGGNENFIGDRILVGNNLPYLWAKFLPTGVFERFANPGEQQIVKNGANNVFWSNPPNSTAPLVQRTRQSQVQILPDLGSVERDGFWETEAARKPAGYQNSGGLRVITGAGIYIDEVITTSGGIGIRSADPLAPANASSVKSFLPPPSLNAGISITDTPKFTTATITPPSNGNIIVWSDLMPMWDGSKKGDLQMRATAVYHYIQGSTAITGEVDANQVPIACVSSYYDPTNATTAKNKTIDGGYGVDVNGNSNNGVTYRAPYTNDAGRVSTALNPSSAYRAKLNRQARMIFPTGRIVNEPLRKALTNYDAGKDRSLADNAAIDTAICALGILDGSLTVQPSPNVPHKAIKEASFLDARQVKSLNNDIKPDGTLDNTKIAETKAKLTENYTLPLEQRQPLEIRVTELDMNLLRTTAIGTATNTNSNDSGNNQEYLLPNSGIIYATRDDALPDESDNNTDLNTRLSVSAADFKLDSTRRPNGIRLINGSNIARTNFFRVAEKGLILATNLPTYTEGDFNLHKDPGSTTVRQEFVESLADDWSNFYQRGDTALNASFACRQGQQNCSGTGDQWRPATIISDSQTLLSKDFKDGFRDQGDYDLNNNQGNSAAENRLTNGFWNNIFVTNATYWNTSGTDGFPTAAAKNSYLTNGVTPVQRRGRFSEYLMEVCPKLPVDSCGANDWFVDPATNLKASAVTVINVVFNSSVHKAGTTAQSAASDYQRYPRRVAFLRDANGRLVHESNRPVPLGIKSGKIQKFPYNGSGATPDSRDNALWFKTTNSDTDPRIDYQYGFGVDSLFMEYMPANLSTDQPQLVPVLQIHYPTGTPQTSYSSLLGTTQENNWLQQADTTTANAAFITGDSPARSSISGSTSSERGGGLQNFVRFLERWSGETARISGSFIQYKRSSYASAPFFPVDPSAATQASSGLFYTLNSSQALYMSGFGETGFRYRTSIVERRASFYVPPIRAFGFDVALLSQSPDLFAQRLTTNTTTAPSEFFREVGQDDSWVKPLLCAVQESGSGSSRAIDEPPGDCPAIPSN